ncbi:proline hydroxylase [Noviherbaspirillum saxi]|uniref:Proline hydroxylase n=2 Tax=Noviherbaspirillum saxi TaxID=2320863 RepID=A0A3A3FNM6_9BURK|nr:proline hydroxylase [Noviherbaspirillum saxi]
MNSALVALPKEWQAWINANLARSCHPDEMAAIMVRDGHFDGQLARAAIDEALHRSGDGQAQAPAIQPMPRLDGASNTIQALDRQVQVLLSLQAPRVVLFGNVLSDEECDAMIAYTESRLERSPVVSDRDGSTQVHAHRSSRGAMLQRGECELVSRIENRLAALIDWPVENGEGLQVLRYEKDNEYRPHYDWFDAASPGPRKHLERGGQRVATIIMYLSEVEEGGGTSFPNIGLQVQPKKGSAVCFLNTDHYGNPDQKTLHAGEPVARGVKVIATKWLRQREYR